MKNRQEPFSLFQEIIGFYPKNIELYKLAVRHRSMQLKSADGQWINNERLEFLGDAVLNSIVADVLYHNYENNYVFQSLVSFNQAQKRPFQLVKIKKLD